MENTDMLKSLQQAVEISKLLQQTPEPESGQTTKAPSENMDNMVKMMEMMQLFSKLSDVTSPSPGTLDKTIKVKFYDDDIHTPGLKSIKSAIPYLEYHNQRTLGIFVKLIELQKLMEKYSHSVVVGTEIKSQTEWQRGMLTAIYPHMEGIKKQKLEMLIKMIDLQEIMIGMKEVVKP